MQKHDEEKPSCRESLATDLQKGWDSTDRLADRVDGYSNLKQATCEFTDWARDGGIPQFDRKASRVFRKVENCGSYLIFRNYLTSNRSRLIGACSCKEHLLCAFCAARRGVRNTMAYQEKVNECQKMNPNQQLLLITFTVQNGVDLYERFSHLRASMQHFLKRRTDSYKENRKTPSSFGLVNGGVFAYEFKRGSGLDLWHPHIHMLALVDKGVTLNYQAIKDEWLHVTGDSHVVNVERVTDDSAFLEVFAYALKFSEMEHSDRWHAFGLLKGERLISSFGTLRGVEVPDTVTDDLLDSDEPWIDLIFRFRKHVGYLDPTIIDRSDRKEAA